MATEPHNGQEIPIEPEGGLILSLIREDQNFQPPLNHPTQIPLPTQEEQPSQPPLNQPIQIPLPSSNETTSFKDKAINKLTPFDSNQKKIITIIQEC